MKLCMSPSYVPLPPLRSNKEMLDRKGLIRSHKLEGQKIQWPNKKEKRLQLEIKLSRGGGGRVGFQFCPKPGPGFPSTNIVNFIVFNTFQ